MNKGTKNFQDLTEKSYAVKNLYRKLNTPSFYRTITNFFDTKKLEWVPNANYSKYSKNFYGEQKFSFKEKIIKLLSYLNLIKTSMNLDIDFSVSEKGYYRSPHRDRNTRVINFLIYQILSKKSTEVHLKFMNSNIIKVAKKVIQGFPPKMTSNV